MTINAVELKIADALVESGVKLEKALRVTDRTVRKLLKAKAWKALWQAGKKTLSERDAAGNRLAAWLQAYYRSEGFAAATVTFQPSQDSILLFQHPALPGGQFEI